MGRCRRWGGVTLHAQCVTTWIYIKQGSLAFLCTLYFFRSALTVPSGDVGISLYFFVFKLPWIQIQILTVAMLTPLPIQKEQAE